MAYNILHGMKRRMACFSIQKLGRHLLISNCTAKIHTSHFDENIRPKFHMQHLHLQTAACRQKRTWKYRVGERLWSDHDLNVMLILFKEKRRQNVIIFNVRTKIRNNISTKVIFIEAQHCEYKMYEYRYRMEPMQNVKQ